MMSAQRRKRTYGSVGKFIRRMRKPKAELRIFDPVQLQPPPITEAEVAGKRFFCVRGHMKSGTNWVSNLLNLHPNVSCTGEYHFHHLTNGIHEMFQRVDWLQSNREQGESFHREFELLMKRTMLRRANRHAKWIGDRTPGTLHPVVFPDAPHICIIRDCRDVVVSRIFHLFNRAEHGVISREIASDPRLQTQLQRFQANPDYFDQNPRELLQSEGAIRRAARSWRLHLREDRAWLQRQPDLNVLIIRYEQLHDDVIYYRNQMLEFLGVDASLANPIDEVTSPGFERPLENRHYRKGRVGGWKAHMTKDAQRWITEEAGDELIEQGYARTRNW